jgi:hypothetical protein
VKRGGWLTGTLLATLAAAWWAAGLDDDEPAPEHGTRKAVRRDTARRAMAAPPDLTGLALLAREPAASPLDRDLPNLFPPRSFVPPPPPEPLPTPVAPSLPFRYSGMLEDGGPLAVLLAHGEEVRAVRAGDVLDGRYRVTAVNRSRVDFIYLPLNAPQSLLTGALP